MEDLGRLSIGELRKRLRTEYPQCRGSFAGSATKAEVLAVLEETKAPGQALTDYFQRKSPGGVAVPGSASEAYAAIHPGADAPPEGAGGENPPDGESHMAETDGKENLTKILDAVRTLYPVAAKELTEMIEASEAVKSYDKSTSMIATDGKVKIGGVEVPVILDGPPENSEGESQGVYGHNWPFVPAVDANYRFDIWRAERSIGAVKFRQEVSDFVKLLMADMRIMLVGPPSCGKTSLPMQYAARCGHPVTRFNGNRDITVNDAVGCYEARDGETHWVDGPVVRAMKEGHILILDEVDHMPAECSSVLHSVLEPRGKLVITGNGGEVVEPHPNFRIVATANTAGFGDESGLHPNAQVQDAAFLSRFDCVFRVAWLAAKDEKSLLVKLGTDADTAKLMVKVANDTRKAVEQGDLLYPITLRQTMGWATMSQVLGDVATAFALSVLNKIPESDIAAVSEIAQRHFGEKIGKV